MADPKSLHEYLIESVDEELRERTGLDGRAVILRGHERYDEARFAEERARRRRELRKVMPLLAEEEWTIDP